MQTTPELLRAWQASLHLTQAQAAQRLGASLRTYCQWIAGRNKPSRIWQERIDQITSQHVSQQ
jgi:DNA-binding XRE family transcriptional regulator